MTSDMIIEPTSALHAPMPSLQVWLNSESSGLPHLLNQSPPPPQQLWLSFRMVSHSWRTRRQQYRIWLDNPRCPLPRYAQNWHHLSYPNTVVSATTASRMVPHSCNVTPGLKKIPWSLGPGGHAHRELFLPCCQCSRALNNDGQGKFHPVGGALLRASFPG